MDEPDRRTLARQGVSYLLVGSSTALLEFALFQALYSFTPLSAVPSNVIAVISATALNFCLNRTVSFQSTANPLRSAVLYCALFAFNLFFSSTAIHLLIGVGCHSALAKILTQGCTVVWNFVLYRTVIFK